LELFAMCRQTPASSQLAETITVIDSYRDLLCCCVKAWLQLVAFGQRSILCHWESSWPAFYHGTARRLLIPSFCLFRHQTDI
jgi:hypothetical protein